VASTLVAVSATHVTVKEMDVLPSKTEPKSYGEEQLIAAFTGDPNPYRYPTVVLTYTLLSPKTGRENFVTHGMSNPLSCRNGPPLNGGIGS
jgi:hypothetical protein